MAVPRPSTTPPVATTPPAAAAAGPRASNDAAVAADTRAEPGMPAMSTAAAIFTVAGLVALWAGRDIFVPIALAVLLSFVLAPLVRRLQSFRIPRAAAVPLVVLLAFLIIAGLATVVATQLSMLASNLPQYQTVIREKAVAARGMLAGRGTLERAADLLQDLGRELKNQPAPGTVGPGLEPTTPKPVPVEVHQPEPGPLRMLGDMLAPIVHPLATAGLIVIFVVFILLQREDLRNRMIRLAGSHDIQRTTAAIDDAAHRLSKLYLAQLGLNFGFGAFIAAGLWLIGLPSPLLWGILAAVLRFVPYVGGIIAAAFPLTLAIAVDPGWSMFGWTLALFLIGEPLVGHVLEPFFFGKSTGLSPVAVVLSAAFWTWLWGPIGLVLATPLTVCLVVLGRHVERLEFLDVMFGSTPALSPPEVFYQRMLARDPIEAADQAEEFLADRRLTEYYDDVALPGLRLAQEDLRRGALDDARSETVRQAVADLVEDLTETVPELRRLSADEAQGEVGTEPPLPDSWGQVSRVLCIPGRNRLDEATALMLGHALARAGIANTVEETGALAGLRVQQLDTENIEVVVLCYLDTTSLGHMRYAARRLRRRFPAVTLIVAAWDGDDGVGPERLAQALGADNVVASIADTVRSLKSIAAESEDAIVEDHSPASRGEHTGEAPDAPAVVHPLPA